MWTIVHLNPVPIKFSYLNFHPLKGVSQYCHPQIEMGENWSYLFNLRTFILIPITVIWSFNQTNYKQL